MTFPTPKLGLEYVDPAAFVAVGVGKINANSTRVENFMGAVVVTSTTRPSVPYAGQQIYETDTRLLRIRNAANTAWVTTNQMTGVGATTEVVTPVTGDVVFVRPDKAFYFYTGSTWQRLLPLPHAAQSQLTSGTLVPNAAVTLFQQTVPYPGFDYWLEVAGQVGWAMSAASQVDKLIRLSATIDTAVPDTNRISTSYQLSRSIGAGFTQPSAILAPKNSAAFGAFNNSKVVRLMVTNMSDANMTLPATAVDSFFNVRVLPAG